jgi:hypothetical protein
MAELQLLSNAVRRFLAQLAPPDSWQRMSMVGFFAVRSDSNNKAWIFGLSRNRRR